MKYMIASDIHGSAFYCRKLLEAFEIRANRLVYWRYCFITDHRNDLPRSMLPKKCLPC